MEKLRKWLKAQRELYLTKIENHASNPRYLYGYLDSIDDTLRELEKEQPSPKEKPPIDSYSYPKTQPRQKKEEEVAVRPNVTDNELLSRNHLGGDKW